jgi:hypothetical protein
LANKAEAVASYAKPVALVDVQAKPLPANSAREMASSGEDQQRRLSEPLASFICPTSSPDGRLDLGPFKVVEFFAREIEDLRADHHRNMDASAIENIAGHDLSLTRPSQAALFGRQ